MGFDPTAKEVRYLVITPEPTGFDPTAKEVRSLVITPTPTGFDPNPTRTPTPNP